MTDVDTHEHDYDYQGIVYEVDPSPMSGTGATRVYYYEAYFCRRCLVHRYDRILTENSHTYEKIRYEATPMPERGLAPVG